MCTGRVDLSFILRALQRGADGVIIGGCWPGECHYVTEGNYDALGNVMLCRKLLARLGLDPARLRLEWIAASEGSRFAEVMNDFVAQVRGLGPLGQAEGVAAEALQRRLQVAQQLVPYIKLAERERLRVPEKSEAAYERFWGSEEAGRLFGELVGERLAQGEILQLLRERPRSLAQIAEALGLDSSEVSRQMTRASRQGLLRYDPGQNLYVIA